MVVNSLLPLRQLIRLNFCGPQAARHERSCTVQFKLAIRSSKERTIQRRFSLNTKVSVVKSKIIFESYIMEVIFNLEMSRHISQLHELKLISLLPPELSHFFYKLGLKVFKDYFTYGFVNYTSAIFLQNNKMTSCSFYPLQTL